VIVLCPVLSSIEPRYMGLMLESFIKRVMGWEVMWLSFEREMVELLSPTMRMASVALKDFRKIRMGLLC
jgi:hypothetical protein